MSVMKRSRDCGIGATDLTHKDLMDTETVRGKETGKGGREEGWEGWGRSEDERKGRRRDYLRCVNYIVRNG